MLFRDTRMVKLFLVKFELQKRVEPFQLLRALRQPHSLFIFSSENKMPTLM